MARIGKKPMRHFTILYSAVSLAQVLITIILYMKGKTFLPGGNTAAGCLPYEVHTMATISKLQASIKLLHGDQGATLASFAASFREDYAHFATANNREALNQAVGELKKSPKDRAIGEAISEAYKAGALAIGYIGARAGKFSAQSKEVQDVFNVAIDRACEAFNESLWACEAFKDRTPKTEAEKAKAKEAKEAKAKEAKEALIVAMVQAGEIVRTRDIKKLEDMGQTALLDALLAIETVGTAVSFDGYHFAVLETMRAELEALKEEYDTVHELAANAQSLKPKVRPHVKTRATV